MRRIPSLDGLRAVSISLVILWHFNTASIPGLWRIDYGNLGVRVFFVISGFLITTLLLTEESDLRTFYTRRIARIMPAYWLYFVSVGLLIPTGWVSAHYRDLLPAFFYLTDYVKVGLALGATWSLSVEEQFYLLWPSMLRWGRRNAVWACVGTLAVAPLFRVLCDVGLWPTNPRYAFECVADALATGCLLALLRGKLLEIPCVRFLPAVVLFALALQPPQLGVDLLGIPLLNISIALFIDDVMRRPPGWLNSRPLVWIGTLSYSLYLWQQLFIGSFPFWLKLTATVVCACASYYLVEKPARRWLNTRMGATAPTSRGGR
jgi:peptidoglycan/LPS O-acetylase OafA/YrhL